MKISSFLHLIVTMAFVFACQQPKDELPYIDVRINYPEKEFFIGPSNFRKIFENGFYFELDLLELKQAYTENRLSGKLKELVATLKDDDNNVFMMVKFK